MGSKRGPLFTAGGDSDMSTPATRRSERKRAVNTRIADLDSSPTQQRAQPSSRKRKASQHEISRPRRRVKSPELEVLNRNQDSDNETAVEDGVDDNDSGDDDEVPTDAEVVIPHLTCSKEPIVMTTTHNNKNVEDRYGHETIQAFAKVCGRDWTYYVKDPTIHFGRELAPQPPLDGGDAEQTAQDKDGEKIHIDLGPSKVVSRIHASIRYGELDGGWYFEVHGRNGARIDDEDLRRGQTRPVHSGTVITIAGTEMLFQVADQDANIHQTFIDRVFRHDEELENGGMFEGPGNGRAPPPPFYLMSGPPLNGGPRIPDYSNPRGGYYGQPNIVPAPAGMVRRPVTPTPSPPKASAGSSKKRSPGNRRGVNGMMMESTEQIDYASESSKAIKPACSYAAMITWAITSVPEQNLSLAAIYEWIKAHYAFYRYSQGGWQNSIRHNLSLNTAFKKVPRRSDEPGKGMKWALEPSQRDATIAQANKNASKGGGRIISAPNTPLGGPSSSSGFVPPATNGDLKTSPRSRTPPLSSYPITQPESYTPVHGPQMPAPAYTPQMPAYAPTQGSLPVLSDETSPMPRRRTNGQLPALDSSPTLTSGTWANDAPMRTPAPRPHNLNVPQPNTAKLPTSHMADSSPAPFWKFDARNETPGGYWPDISPLKNGAGGPVLASSSPPPVTNGAESPTRRPRPAMAVENQNGASRGEDEDGSIDITMGFPKISSFHEQRSNRKDGDK